MTRSPAWPWAATAAALLIPSPGVAAVTVGAAPGPSLYSSSAIAVAVAIFVTRELLEGRRRRTERRGRLRAIRTLLARATELNHWTIKSLRNVLERIQADFHDEDRPDYSLALRRDGAVFLNVRHANGDLVQIPLPEVRRESLEAQLLNVAELDGALVGRLEPAITMLAELDHVRANLISYLLKEDDSEAPYFEGFVEFALTALSDAYVALDTLYRACTDEPLLHHRVR